MVRFSLDFSKLGAPTTAAAARRTPRTPRGVSTQRNATTTGAVQHSLRRAKVAELPRPVEIQELDQIPDSEDAALLFKLRSQLCYAERDILTADKARLIQEVVVLRQHLQNTASQRDKVAVDLKRANANLHTLQREDRGHWEKAHLWGQYADARQRILALMESKEGLEAKLCREKADSRALACRVANVEELLKQEKHKNDSLVAVAAIAFQVMNAM